MEQVTVTTAHFKRKKNEGDLFKEREEKDATICFDSNGKGHIQAKFSVVRKQNIKQLVM